MPSNPKPTKHPTSPDKAQLDRFKQIARELGCDETGEAFERAFAKVTVAQRPSRKKAPQDKQS